MTPRVLVAYGSTEGSTAELADWVGTELRRAGLLADVLPATSVVGDVASYDAVVVGGAVYLRRWHHDARRFVRRHEAALRRVPVWLFSSGPLDSSAAGGDLVPPRAAADAGRRVGAREHVTFGGCLREHPHRLLARLMARSAAGDWRDRAAVETWARRIAVDLQPPHPQGVHQPSRSPTQS